jgi:hypothetical protein
MRMYLLKPESDVARGFLDGDGDGGSRTRRVHTTTTTNRAQRDVRGLDPRALQVVPTLSRVLLAGPRTCRAGAAPKVTLNYDDNAPGEREQPPRRRLCAFTLILAVLG